MINRSNDYRHPSQINSSPYKTKIQPITSKITGNEGRRRENGERNQDTALATNPKQLPIKRKDPSRH